MADVTTRMSASEFRRLASLKIPAAKSGGARKAKYGNKKVGQFDSVKESRYWSELQLQRHAADLSARVVDVQHHVRYEVIPPQEGERATFYEADFVVTYADGRKEVVDVKSDITRQNRAYVLKRKLMLSIHGIRVKEV